MKRAKKKLITYKRHKNGVKISGEADQVKSIIWFDLLVVKLFKLILLTILLWRLFEK